MHCPVRYADAVDATVPTGKARWCSRCNGWHAIHDVSGRQRRFERRLADRREQR